MTNQENRSKDAADPSASSGWDLRQKAEALAWERVARTPENSAALSPEEIRKTLHELRVHQIELEMQNKELRTAQAEIEAGRTRYFDLYDLAPVGYCTLYEQGLILEANLTASSLLGVALGMLVNQPISRFILKDDQDIYYLQRKKLFETGEAQECELRLVKPDGAVFWAHLTATATKAEDGRPVSLVAISDINERKRAEEELAAQYRLLRVAGETTSFGGWSVDLATNTCTWSDTVAEIHGMPIGFSPKVEEGIAFYAPEWREKIKEVFTACAGEGIPYDEEMQIVTGAGKRVWVRTAGEAVRDGDGRIVLVQGSFQDITQQKQADEELKLSHGNFYRAFSSSPAALAISRLEDGKFITVNDAFSRIMGYQAGEIVGLTASDLHIYVNQNERSQLVQELHDKGTIRNYELLARSKTGSIRHLLINMEPTIYNNEKAILSAFIDITERKRAEKALKEAYDIISRSASVAFTWKNTEGWPVEFVSENIERLLGYKAEAFITGEVSYIDCIHPQDVKRVLEELAKMSAQEESVEFVHETYRLIARDGSEKFVRDWTFIVRDSDGRITHYKGTVEDITEHLKLEAQFQQAQKMEAVGRLAGGVAHDFNNILSVILGYSELALNKVGPEDPLRENLKEIYDAAVRSRGIIRQLLAFARKETIAPKVLDLNESIESMLKILQQLIGEDIDLAWHPGMVPWPILMDPSQLDQILANLCINARDAIANVGKITIETSAAAIDADYCSRHAGFIPGEFVLLAVSDDGVGMDRETLDHIFEPFFTTKGSGKGTGLGLATVYGIVKQNNGFINVYSEPGSGTTFRIYLPGNLGDISGKQRIIDEQVPDGNGETVLVVEDEMSILRLIEAILSQRNYEVLPANSPSEALEAAQTHSGEISLLITDVVMPEMNGRELADRLKLLRPGIKCLFMSGYTADVIVRRGVLDEGVQFIQKPFSIKGLAAKVKDALEKKTK